jgi:hypothetical protein
VLLTRVLAPDTLSTGHHHAPAYETPPSVQQRCTPAEPGEDGGSCVCNLAGMNKANPWKGAQVVLSSPHLMVSGGSLHVHVPGSSKQRLSTAWVCMRAAAPMRHPHA